MLTSDVMEEIMPYNTTDELPEAVRNVLPQGARDIFKEAFNSAWDEYADPAKRRGSEGQEETAMRVAWAAVKNKYAKCDDGNWHRK